MAQHTVNIELHAGGGSQVAGEVGKVGKATTDLIVNIKKFGNLFGELGSNLGSLGQNLLKGGVWGIAQSIVQIGWDAFQQWRDAEEKAAEEAARIARELLEKRKAAIEEHVAAVTRAANIEKDWISHGLSMTQKRIDATKNLTKATLEYEKVLARSKGDLEGMAAADRKISEADADAQMKGLRARRDSALARRGVAEKQLPELQKAISGMGIVVKNYESQIKEGKRKHWTSWNPYDYAAADANLREYMESDQYKSLVSGKKDAEKKLADYQERAIKLEQEKQKADADYKESLRSIKAFQISQEAQSLNSIVEEEEKARAEDEKAREKEADDIRKFEAEKKRLEKAISDERRKLYAIDAAERAKVERALHKQRMEDLREEMAAQKSAASVLTSRSAAAQSEFDRAFAMFRDPARAAAEIGEEKAYQSDLDRLHKSARRYGGKWRIDELSRLMAAGDTQGVTDTLNAWRKTKGFTPEVEAMVRASAAENAKTTVEEELRKIDDKVASMNDVLKQMADAQSGKLGSIADNTSGLAAKVDQLLHVKG